ncbi:hypothetical protein, variant 1 [Aphanomyces astaci]|uniref:Xaa-Pro dipeptidyl-peptidase-like domain-containing protein n=1 Tax=Aphanomyces astaci TaxID=112090 RepID=W4H479_APHAT|nr:hypothetical protein, variant 1 [Aphanomyces astaci]ETV86411.1 hypothetical protein, variant 1 [Aphanomyces astaci]|eukprot:XP_009824884.1 hypothetical protein, variant 1 [Aphanomyces astaci]
MNMHEVYPRNTLIWKVATGTVLFGSAVLLFPLLLCALVVYIPYKKIKAALARPQPSDRFDYQASNVTTPPLYTMTSQYITTTDGTRIAIDLYLPTDSICASPRACILTQTRYFRSISLRWPWRLLANQGRPFSFLHTRYYEGMLGAGYAVVAMDIRGTGASFGTVLHPWHVLERQDSVDVIDWITRQPWSNGRVGLWGMSYEATAAYLTVSTHHPAIKACVPMYMFYDMYSDIASPGGIAQHFFTLKWAELTAYLDRNAMSDLPAMMGLGRLFFQGVTPASRDWDDLVCAVAEHETNWKAEIHPSLNRDSHTNGNITPGDLSLSHVRHAMEMSTVPMLYYTGWYDQTVRSSLQGFSLVPQRSQVVIGPWNHSGVQFYNPVTQIHQRSACDHVNRVVSFFRHHLNDDVTACSAATFTGSIEYFTLGDNTWRVATSWPPPHATRHDFFLSMNDRALVTDVRAIQPGSCTWNVEYQRDLGGVSRWQATIDVYEPMQYHGWHAANHVVFTSLPFDHSVTRANVERHTPRKMARAAA